MPFHPSHKLSLQTAKFLVVALRNAVAECPEITTWSGNLIVDDRDGNALGIRIDDLGKVTVTNNGVVVAKYTSPQEVE